MLFLPIGKVVEENFATVQYYAEDAGLPIIASHAPNVPSGALAGLVANHTNLGMLCGQMAAQILTGTSPKDIPVATPQQLDILINAAVADSLGIEIPVELEEKAAEIYR
jgi:putative ABC transport system substrate-binding protein